MKGFKFSGEDTTIIFDFLRRLVRKADLTDMDEGQLIVCLPHMLTKIAASESRSK